MIIVKPPSALNVKSKHFTVVIIHRLSANLVLAVDPRAPKSEILPTLDRTIGLKERTNE